MAELADKLAGKFIVIDGPDGAGKSTQVKLLAGDLRGRGLTVCEVRDPGGTAIGERVRQILLDVGHHGMATTTETMLFMASRAQLVAEVIGPALRRGECVVGDRFISSTVAYQGAGGMDSSAVRAVGQIAVGGLWPDLTVILDLPAEQGFERLREARDRMESKDAAFHREVRRLFLAQAAEDPDRFAVVDATGSVEAVHRRVQGVVHGWKWKH